MRVKKFLNGLINKVFPTKVDSDIVEETESRIKLLISNKRFISQLEYDRAKLDIISQVQSDFENKFIDEEFQQYFISLLVNDKFEPANGTATQYLNDSMKKYTREVVKQDDAIINYLWVSENDKWAIRDLYINDGIHTASVVDLVKNKNHNIIVGHITQGNISLIPKYVQNKILELEELYYARKN